MIVKLTIYDPKENKVVERLKTIADTGDIYYNIALALGMRYDSATDPLWYMCQRGCLRYEKVA